MNGTSAAELREGLRRLAEREAQERAAAERPAPDHGLAA